MVRLAVYQFECDIDGEGNLIELSGVNEVNERGSSPNNLLPSDIS